MNQTNKQTDELCKNNRTERHQKKQKATEASSKHTLKKMSNDCSHNKSIKYNQGQFVKKRSNQHWRRETRRNEMKRNKKK